MDNGSDSYHYFCLLLCPNVDLLEFRVNVASTKFEGMPLVARHRMVYTILKEEMQEMGVHALALKTRVPEETSADH